MKLASTSPTLSGVDRRFICRWIHDLVERRPLGRVRFESSDFLANALIFRDVPVAVLDKLRATPRPDYRRIIVLTISIGDTIEWTMAGASH